MKILSFFYLFIFLVSFDVQAGRAVYQELNQNEVIELSDFIFLGWPSPDKTPGTCPHETGRWWVHKVYRGDKSLENKVIALADHQYRIWSNLSPGKKSPSHKAFTYKTGILNRDQGSSFLFTNRRADGCFELVSAGAQEAGVAEIEMEAVLADQTDCPKILRGFESRASAMPVDCKQDSDCKIYDVHPNSCGKPYLWNVSAALKMDSGFKHLQAKTKKACSKEWGNLEECRPQFFPIHCKAHRCVEGKDPTLVSDKFEKGSISESCAPHDASSMMMALSMSTNAYPSLNINWWGNGRPSVKGGKFTFQGENDLYPLGVQANYCLYRGSCKSFKSLRMKLLWSSGQTESSLEYQGTLNDGQTMSGNVNLKYIPGRGVGCG